MSKTFVIAEAACSWRYGQDHLAIAERSIRETKASGADAWKTQWTSSGPAMAKRRGLDEAAGSMYAKYLMYPQDWLGKLKGMCDAEGIEFMCTVYLPQDIPVIAPLVKRFKVSAFESGDGELIRGLDYHRKPLIVSFNHERPVPGAAFAGACLYCVSEYPTPLEHLQLSRMDTERAYDGLSDHTTSTLTGALAVAAGATILEKHVRLWDTPQDNPDYGHSLILDSDGEQMSFAAYVRNVREAERCM